MEEKAKKKLIKSLNEIKQRVVNGDYYYLDDVVTEIRDLDWVIDLRCSDNIRPFSELESDFEGFRKKWGLYTAIKKCEEIEGDEPYYMGAYDILKTATEEDVIDWIYDLIDDIKVLK